MSKATLLTGATGFIGGELARSLSSSGGETYALVRSRRAAGQLPDGIQILEAPATAQELKAMLSPLQFSRVFHLATHFVAEHSTDDVEPLVSSNLLFGAQLAESVATDEMPPVFVNTGTAWQSGPEGSYQPAALYAATKQAFEDMLRYYALAKQLRVVNVRLFDTYGPHDSRRKLVDLLVEAALDGRPIDLSPGDQLLNLTHVSDVVDALLKAAQSAETQQEAFWTTCGIYGEETLTVRDLAQAVERASGLGLDARWGARPYREREMFELWDAGPALPGWNPAISLDQGLKGLIDERT